MIFQSQLVPFTNIFFWYQLLVWQAVSNAISKIDIQWVNYHFYCARVSIAGTIMNWSKQIIYGLAQDSWNASALAIKLLQSCTKSSIWEWLHTLYCQRFCKINVDKRYTYGHYSCKSQISTKPHITKPWNVDWTFHEPIYKYMHILQNDSRLLFYQRLCLVVETKPLRVHAYLY